MEIFDTKNGTYLIDGGKVFALEGLSITPIYVQVQKYETPVAERLKKRVERFEDWPLDAQGFTARFVSVLMRNELHSWGDVKKTTRDQRLRMPGFGLRYESHLKAEAQAQGVDIDF